MTRSEIADAAELSRPTVSAAVKELIADGVLTEQPGETGPGRTPARLVLAPPPGIVAAIELGEDFEAIALARAGKPQVTLGPQTLAGAVTRLGRLLARNRLPVERLRVVVLGGDGDLQRELEEQLGVAPAVAVEPAAQLAALGEGHDDVVFLHAAASLGLGLVLGGELRRGHRGRAGDFAHTTVSPRAPEPLVRPAPCLGCGQRDCLQNLASVPAIVAQLSGLTGEPLDFKAVLDRREPIYADAIRSAALRLGYALADVVRVLDPERVVIGGLLARAPAELVLDPIRATGGIEAALVDEVYTSVVKGGLKLGRDLQVVEPGLDEAGR